MLDIAWSSVFAGVAFFVLFVVALAAAAITYESAKSDIKLAGWAFNAAAFAIFWTFCGYGILRSLFSGEMLGPAYWSWFEGRTWEWSASGVGIFFGIFGSCLLFVFVYSVLVSLTLWNFPKIGRTRTERRISWAAFLSLLALDYGWLCRVPAWLF